ncbi:hypothetical protein [Radiobacillus sp. PE A8.2]|uniref:hypothetical protein n=1 Tax=Radiobacillus sp. PE A8.2 TaxID=3380349 RepID=UPI00388D5A5B
MSNIENNDAQETKKLTVQEKMKLQLERKKQAQVNGGNNSSFSNGSKPQMKSQQAKKASVTRRKMGG